MLMLCISVMLIVDKNLSRYQDIKRHENTVNFHIFLFRFVPNIAHPTTRHNK